MPKNFLLNRLEYYPFRVLVALLRLLPYRCSKAIVVWLFSSVGYGLGIRRDVAEKQLRAVYPQWDESKIKSVLKDVYRQMALNIIDEYLVSDDDLLKKSEIKGKEHLDNALKEGRGVILATAHFGNWEAARVLPMVGVPLSVIVKRQRNRLFDDYTNRIRTRSGLRIIDMKRGLKGMMGDLKENRVVAILADQNAGKNGLIMDFLGFPASHWKGVAKISLRYQIPIVPGFVVRNADDSLTFEFHEPIIEHRLSDEEENYVLVLEKVNQHIESYIHEYPSQWFWVHKRWKHAHDFFER